MSNVHVVIPARYKSSRLPGKPLLDIAGRPMIWHVYQRALESGFSSITIATDDKRIFDVASDFGADVVLTSEAHQSGTDRLSEVAVNKNYLDTDIVINLQGDEPLVPFQCIQTIANAFNKSSNIDIATLSCGIENVEDVFNPNVVKVVSDDHRRAMYFSRAPIPWQRGVFELNNSENEFLHVYERHIGMYAYRVDKLKELTSLPVSTLERIESLEQLRALASGMKIYVERLSFSPSHGIDTKEDYEKVLKVLSGSHESP